MSRPVTSLHGESARTPRFRARRIAIDPSKLGPVRATMRHPELGVITGEVLDLSLHGIGVEIPVRNGLSGMLLSGDRLESVEISAESAVFYRGEATVRRITEESERQVIGLEVDGDGLDLAELHRSGA